METHKIQQCNSNALVLNFLTVSIFHLIQSLNQHFGSIIDHADDVQHIIILPPHFSFFPSPLLKSDNVFIFKFNNLQSLYLNTYNKKAFGPTEQAEDRSMRFNRNLMFMMILSGKKKQNQNQNLGLKVKTEVGNKIGVVLFNYMFHCSKWQ